MKITERGQGFKGARFQVKGMELKTLEPLEPGILELYFRINKYRALGFCRTR
jgi:hypothetical protein